MNGESRWQRVRGTVAAWRRVRLAAWCTAVGLALSLVTVTLSAFNAVSTQQAIALAMPAVLITVGGIAGLIVPDAWIAWRRGFRHGCEAAMVVQPQTYVLRADDAGSRIGQIRLARLTTYPPARYCAVCGRGRN
jgi:hypothetical protein